MTTFKHLIEEIIEEVLSEDSTSMMPKKIKEYLTKYEPGFEARTFKVKGNVITFVVDESMATYDVTLTINNDGSITEEVEGMVNKFKTLEDYRKYLVDLHN